MEFTTLWWCFYTQIYCYSGFLLNGIRCTTKWKILKKKRNKIVYTIRCNNVYLTWMFFFIFFFSLPRWNVFRASLQFHSNQSNGHSRYQYYSVCAFFFVSIIKCLIDDLYLLIISFNSQWIPVGSLTTIF